MSDQPLGRDRLGRLVYAGDVLKSDNGGGVVVWNPHTDDERDFIAHCAKFDAVDLAASQKRTNYKRYFADLGTINQIIVAYMDDALQSDDLFWFDFEHDLWWDYGHAGFETWLQQEATV